MLNIFVLCIVDVLLGLEIVQVIGNDVDFGSVLWYVLSFFGFQDFFSIGRYGGRFFFIGLLDFEQRDRYYLQLLVYDGFYEGRVNFIVLVEDVNDNAFVFSQSFYQVLMFIDVFKFGFRVVYFGEK